MKKSINLLTLFCLVALFAVSVTAQQRVMKKQVAQQPKLELTEEQKEKIDDLRTTWQIESTKLQAEKKIAGIELQKLLKDDNASENAIRSQMEKVSQFGIDARMAQRAHHKEIRGLLTEEQRTIFDSQRKRGQNRQRGVRGQARGMRGQTRGMRGQGRGMRGQGRGMRGVGQGMGGGMMFRNHGEMMELHKETIMPKRMKKGTGGGDTI